MQTKIVLSVLATIGTLNASAVVLNNVGSASIGDQMVQANATGAIVGNGVYNPPVSEINYVAANGQAELDFMTPVGHVDAAGAITGSGKQDENAQGSVSGRVTGPHGAGIEGAAHGSSSYDKDAHTVETQGSITGRGTFDGNTVEGSAQGSGKYADGQISGSGSYNGCITLKDGGRVCGVAANGENSVSTTDPATTEASTSTNDASVIALGGWSAIAAGVLMLMF
ncbi:hypothetical protein MP228_002812 [Amoeboaphelidium protococcarum]|nr:hypothetical protein MP228_002812 [Amoeboaphelidium protococcarum]